MLEVGIGGVILLALVIWATLRILSSSVSTEKKALWVLFILVVPVIGLIFWALLGPKGNRARL